MGYRTLDRLFREHDPTQGHVALVRADVDVSVDEQGQGDVSRIVASISTIKELFAHGYAVLIAGHRKRPKGKEVDAMSTKHLVPALQRLLHQEVRFAGSWRGDAPERMAENLQAGKVGLLENTRFEADEESKDPDARARFAKRMADLADVYVGDAVATMHRDHASITGVAAYLPSYLGRGLQREVKALQSARDAKEGVAVISGVKVETKLPLIRRFLETKDAVLLGGGVANTFLATRYAIGDSLRDEAFLPEAGELMETYGTGDQPRLLLPEDVLIIPTPSDADLRSLPGSVAYENVPVSQVPADHMILDIGQRARDAYMEALMAGTPGPRIWNGPVGYAEHHRFAAGSFSVALGMYQAAGDNKQTIIGGGDTTDFYARYGIRPHQDTFVSMGGGATLEYLASEDDAEMPGLRVLME